LIGQSHHLRIDRAGALWVTDIGRHVVRKLAPNGEVLLTLGTPDAPGEDETHLNKPTDMVVMPDGSIYVTDGYGNHRVVQFDAAGKFVRTWGKLGDGPGEFNQPHAIVADRAGRLYVADRNNARIQVFDGTGKFLAEWRNLVTPWGLQMSAEDELWVCGSSPMAWWPAGGAANPGASPPKDQLVARFTTDGRMTFLWTAPSATPGLNRPGDLGWAHALAFDAAGNLYTAEVASERPQRFLLKR
jgi:sugar lactone lactonase YvrE